MDKKDANNNKDESSTDLFQQIMTDKEFDPFGTFYTLGRHFNPITQGTLYYKKVHYLSTKTIIYLIIRENTFIEDVSKTIKLEKDEYYNNITSKTKDDEDIFDPKLRYTPLIEETIFSKENIVEFDDNLDYKKLKLQNSKEISFQQKHFIFNIFKGQYEKEVSLYFQSQMFTILTN